jgi:hypothetical protein
LSTTSHPKASRVRLTAAENCKDIEDEIDPMKLRDVAHSRTGDKGNTSNISVIAYDSRDYEALLTYVTAARVKQLFEGVVTGDVTRYELPTIGALNFVMTGALGGGVTRSLAIDAHGKSLSSALLNMDLPDDFRSCSGK